MSFTYSALGQNGRLGNQLFQIACTISTALSHGDTFFFPKWSYEDHFNLHKCFESNEVVSENYTQPFFHYQQILIPDSKSKVIDLKGFFQSEKFFKDHERAMRFALTPNDVPATQMDKCSIHVRRGDYLKFKDAHPAASLKYYQSAMKKISCSKYVVFSDDIQWCKENFVGDQFEFSEGKTEIEDLIYMMSMEHNIIANSSFSWWAAYLNKNPNKKIVAPKIWFGSALQDHDIKDLIPSDWICI